MANTQNPAPDTKAEAEVARRYFGSFASDYHDAFRGAGESLLHRTINRLFRRRTFELRTADVEDVLKAFNVDGKQVADLGCGSGEVSLVAARLGARVTGLDIVEDMVRIAREEAQRNGLTERCEFRVFDMVQEALPPADVYMMIGVIEYYRDIEWLLARVAASTRELLIIVDTRGPWWRRTLRYGLARVKHFNLYYHQPSAVVAAARAQSLEEWRHKVGHSYTLFAFRRSWQPEVTHRLVFSVDLDEWYHSRRWVDGRQSKDVVDNRELFKRLYGADRPAGEIIEPTRLLLRLFREHRVAATFFVLGEIAEYYPDLVKEVRDAGHEIACHGLIHVDMTVLGPDRFERQLREAADRLHHLVGVRPVGYRAPNLVYEPWATAILERQGFLYDSSVCPSRSLGGKYRGWLKAPLVPYHPSYTDVAERGDARLVELPLPVFPGIRIAAGSSIITRVFGFHWSRIAINSTLQHGDTAYYAHPWEFGHKPPTEGHSLRNLVFLRRVGSWMQSSLGRLLEEHSRRSAIARDVAATV